MCPSLSLLSFVRIQMKCVSRTKEEEKESTQQTKENVLDSLCFVHLLFIGLFRASFILSVHYKQANERREQRTKKNERRKNKVKWNEERQVERPERVLSSFVHLFFSPFIPPWHLSSGSVFYLFCLFCSSFTFHSCFSLQWNGEERNNNKENTRKTQTMDSCLFLVVRSFHYNGVKNEMRNGSVNEKNKQEQNTKSYGLVPFCFLFFLLAFSWIHASFGCFSCVLFSSFFGQNIM